MQHLCFFCIINTKINPSATFYNPLTRFWELICGALLAWFNHDNKNKYTHPKLLSTAGILLIAAGFWIANKSNFPGWHAIFPTLGATLIIAAGKDAWVNKHLLSLRPMIWIGLISYPLYLWHWPMLVFPKIITGQELSLSHKLLAVAASIAAATMTYAFIEKKVKAYNPRKAAKLLIGLMLITGLLGFATYKANGFPLRKFAQSQGLIGDIGHTKFHEYVATNYFPCKNTEVEQKADRWEGFVRCAQSKDKAEIDVILLGDSHAEHLFIGLADALPEKNVAFYTRGVLPFLDQPESDYLIKAAASEKNAKVLISAYWFGRVGMLPEGSNFSEKLAKCILGLKPGFHVLTG